jgi:excinuclease ABC subunit A
LGNTVVVVEHDTDTIVNANYIIDMGPAAGTGGGCVVASGTAQEIKKNPNSLTGAYLSGKRGIKVPQKLRQPNKFITLTNANTHNLKNINVKFPLNVFCCISGVSGSGKSTLIMDELVPALNSVLNKNVKKLQWIKHIEADRNKITGYELLDSMIVIDQSPIGRTPRSTPATYLGIFDEIRELFASLPESHLRGYKAGTFSFNIKDGRCSKCSGEGIITVSMHFLADVEMICNVCKGTRYNEQTLQIKFRDKNISQILDMTISESYEFFKAHTRLAKKLGVLRDVGLGYIKLGQSSTTLSGGEAQRIKLAAELAKRGANTMYILDEPTTGLHTSDIEKLLQVLQNLVNKGNSIIVIEHNIDVLKTADYIIDLGPEGGDEGGTIVVFGTPNQIAQNKLSHTGKYLKLVLN